MYVFWARRAGSGWTLTVISCHSSFLLFSSCFDPFFDISCDTSTGWTFSVIIIALLVTSSSSPRFDTVHTLPPSLAVALPLHRLFSIINLSWKYINLCNVQKSCYLVYVNSCLLHLRLCCPLCEEY
jgi:hypothetical protein